MRGAVPGIGHGHQLVAQLGRPTLGRTQGPLLILSLVVFRTSIHVFLAIAQHGIADASQLVGRGGDGLGRSQVTPSFGAGTRPGRCRSGAARWRPERNAAAARLVLGLVLELMTLGAFRVSDELWEVLAPLIPKHVNTHPLGGGRPRVPDRTCADGICYVLRTGCQWKALDATGICSGSTAHLRFQEWVAAGVFLELWRVGLERFDELPGLELAEPGRRPDQIALGRGGKPAPIPPTEARAGSSAAC